MVTKNILLSISVENIPFTPLVFETKILNEKQIQRIQKHLKVFMNIPNIISGTWFLKYLYSQLLQNQASG
jgi:hypothetical protein